MTGHQFTSSFLVSLLFFLLSLSLSLSLLRSLPPTHSNHGPTMKREGVSNRLFIVKLKERMTSGRKSQNGRKEEVVIRFYGSSLIPNEAVTSSKSVQLIEERLVSKLSTLNLCPKLLATFPGGRIEPFVPGRTLTIQEINGNFSFSFIVARKLALLHSLSDSWLREIGIERIRTLFTTDVLDTHVNDFHNVRSQLVEHVTDQEDRKIAEYFQKFDFQSEKLFLIQKFNQMKSKIVFSHNDLHCKNIYLTDCDQDDDVNNNRTHFVDEKELEKRIILMDFEYACFNHRWADFAIYFTGN